VRVGHRIISQGVLIVSAVRAPDGFREILGVEVADTESEATYQQLLRSLKERGLKKGVELVVSETTTRGPEGRRLSPLPGSVVAALPIVHYSRNLLGMVGAKRRKDLAAELCGRSSPRRAGGRPCSPGLRGG
jgi:putative transposase